MIIDTQRLFNKNRSFKKIQAVKGQVILKTIVIRSLVHAEQDSYLKIWIRQLWEKMGWKGG